MIDSPIVIVLLGMSAVSGIAYLLNRRKPRLPPPTTAIAAMSTDELTATLAALRPELPEYETRRITVLLIQQELVRRGLPPPQHY